MMKNLLFFLILLIYSNCFGKGEGGLGVFEGSPRINPPYIVANYPATEFIFAVPTSGERPIKWSAEDLPDGLSLNAETGIIRGIVKQAGDYKVTITAKNNKGKKKSILNIKIGEELALTPPMGWNSWNTFGRKLSEALVIETAEAMIANGMRDLGYSYINIDDLWQLADRDSSGHIVIDSTKFPRGIKYVADYLHDRGFKIGIYSDASRYTCAGVCGSYGFEEIDAQDFAAWGIDLLKYDYCGAPEQRDTAIVRYRKMGKALRATQRSIIYSVCEWGRREPWTWAKEVGGHYWRTTEDIRDTWSIASYKSGILPIVDLNKKLADYAGPGAWNDPDMLVVGIFGKSHSINPDTRRYGCTLDEYRAHMSLWCMMASPLLSGNDVRNMADSVKEILLNPEIIAINQDLLGKQAKSVMLKDECEIFVKPLVDGTAITVLNRGKKTKNIQINLSELGMDKVSSLRNVWTHQSLKKTNELSLTIAPHSAEVFVVK
ncbi:MAG: putative Ig domain-containing protein [Odoribacter sp.]